MIKSEKSLNQIINIYRNCNNAKVVPKKSIIIFISICILLTIINIISIHNDWNPLQNLTYISLFFTIIIFRNYSKRCINYKVNREYERLYGEPTQNKYTHFELFLSYILLGFKINNEKNVLLDKSELYAAKKLLSIRIDERKDYRFIPKSKIIVISIITLPIIYNYYKNFLLDVNVVAYCILAIILLPGLVYTLQLFINMREYEEINILRYIDRVLVEIELVSLLNNKKDNYDR